VEQEEYAETPTMDVLRNVKIRMGEKKNSPKSS